MNIYIEDINSYLELNSIELLGYSKNNIIESMERSEELPPKYENKLHKAYKLIDEVQEYLYNR